MTIISKAYFVGDVHLDPRFPAREKAFCRFLDGMKAQHPDALYLMGDIFEFWFGYKTVMFSHYFKVIAKFAELISDGIAISYVVGNHDFHPGPLFRDELGVVIFDHPIRIAIGKYNVYLSHGDEINIKDRGYLFLKRVLRNKLAQKLFSCIPADWSWHLGQLTSDTSRRYTSAQASKIPDDVYRIFLRERIQEGVQVVIHGHTHEFGRKLLEIDGQQIILINSGHWFQPGHYVEFTEGEFHIHEYHFE